MKKIKELGLNIKNKIFVIAEIGLNHGGDLQLAKQLIDSAVRAGADAVKFQTYITEKRVPKDSVIFDVLKKCELPFEAFNELKIYSEARGVLFFSTPFDEESVDYLESIGIELYKVASFDLVNNNLLRKVRNTGKPVILSVGMSSIDEIKEALNILGKGNSKIALLHCISSYPTEEKDANLGAIHTLSSSFPNIVIGQSDHTNDIKIPVYAVAAGAQIIEKHFKITDEMDCIDAPVSISEEKFTKLVIEIRKLEDILGLGIPNSSEVQKGTERYRRYSI